MGAGQGECRLPGLARTRSQPLNRTPSCHYFWSETGACAGKRLERAPCPRKLPRVHDNALPTSELPWLLFFSSVQLWVLKSQCSSLLLSATLTRTPGTPHCGFHCHPRHARPRGPAWLRGCRHKPCWPSPAPAPQPTVADGSQREACCFP